MDAQPYAVIVAQIFEELILEADDNSSIYCPQKFPAM